MKYKLVGALNIFFGLLFSLIQLGFVVSVYPRLMEMYSHFEIKLPLATEYAKPIALVLAVLFLAEAWVGYKLVKSPTEKLLKIGITVLVVMFVFGGYFTVISSLSAIVPIYTISAMP